MVCFVSAALILTEHDYRPVGNIRGGRLAKAALLAELPSVRALVAWGMRQRAPELFRLPKEGV